MYKTAETKAYLIKQKETIRLLHEALEGLLHGPSISIKVYSVKTGDYTITEEDYLIHYEAGSYTVTLPDVDDVEAGQQFVIKNSGAGTITVATTDQQTIDDCKTQLLTQYDAMKIMSDGTNWIIV